MIAISVLSILVDHSPRLLARVQIITAYALSMETGVGEFQHSDRCRPAGDSAGVTGPPATHDRG
jgi:hypothetical protein